MVFNQCASNEQDLGVNTNPCVLITKYAKPNFSKNDYPKTAFNTVATITETYSDMMLKPLCGNPRTRCTLMKSDHV